MGAGLGGAGSRDRGGGIGGSESGKNEAGN